MGWWPIPVNLDSVTPAWIKSKFNINYVICQSWNIPRSALSGWYIFKSLATNTQQQDYLSTVCCKPLSNLKKWNKTRRIWITLDGLELWFCCSGSKFGLQKVNYNFWIELIFALVITNYCSWCINILIKVFLHLCEMC